MEYRGHLGFAAQWSKILSAPHAQSLLSVSVSKTTPFHYLFLKFRCWNWFTVKVALSLVAANAL